MRIAFRPLFTINAAHGYHADGRAALDFVIPRSTAEALAAGRARVRPRDGRLVVFQEVDESGAPVSSLAGLRLAFGFRPADPTFENTTQPLFVDRRARPFYRNAADSAALDAPIAATPAIGLLNVVAIAPERPLTLRLVAMTGATVASLTLSTGESAASFDLRDLPDGLYGIAEDVAAAGPVVRSYSVTSDPDLAAAWGIVEVTVAPEFEAVPATFTVRFEALLDRMRYYIIGHGATAEEMEQLAVKDEGFGEDGRAEIVFAKVQPAAFTAEELPAEALGAEDGRVLLFRSEATVARRDRGLRKIQLTRDGNPLIENLPQPGADRPRADMIVHLSRL